jgi:hypothetical protein
MGNGQPKPPAGRARVKNAANAQNHPDVTLAPGAAIPCFYFEQQAAMSRWTSAIKAKISAAWKLGVNRRQKYFYQDRKERSAGFSGRFFAMQSSAKNRGQRPTV